jgi:Vitamin K-dependent gamma-carboxylase
MRLADRRQAARRGPAQMSLAKPLRATAEPVLDKNYRALSVFRIIFALYLLAEFASLGAHFSDFFGETSILPLSALAPAGSDRVGAALRQGMALFDTPPFPFVLLGLYPLAIVAFGLGYRTRYANAAVLALNSYFYWRNPYVVYGADILARLILLWCLFLPMSRYWSFDAALATGSRTQDYPLLPFLAVRAQVCSVYGFAALVKLSGGPWRDGYALIWALSDNMFGGTPSGRYLVAHFPQALYVADYLVIAFQLAFPLLIFCPWRNHLMRGLAIAGAALMHISFIVCLNIGSFPFLSLAILLLLVPDQWLERLSKRRLARLRDVRIYYEPGCRFCQKTALLLREFLLTPSVPVLPASAEPRAFQLLQEHRSWVVQGDSGVPYLKWHGVAYVLKQRAPLAPLGRLMDWPSIARPLERFYDFIGGKRSLLGRISEVLLPFGAERPVGGFALAICGLLALLGLASNIDSIARISDARTPSAAPRFAELLLDTATALQVAQRWYLFAPVPTHYQRAYELSASEADGGSKNLMQLLATPIYRPRSDGSGIDFANHRWMKYFTYLGSLTDAEWRAFGTYLCRRIRSEVANGGAIRHIEMKVSALPVADPASDAAKDVQRTFDCPPAAP